MTDAERKHAAEVMASDGPWEYRVLNGDKWLPCPHPAWSWHGYEYRVAIPAPEVRCPVCHGNVPDEPKGCGPWRTCMTCGTTFNSAAVKPCPECAKAKAERDDYKGRRERAEEYAVSRNWPGSVMRQILRGEDRG